MRMILHRRRGFTLVEMLFVTAMMGVVATAGATLFAAQARAYRKSMAIRGMYEYTGMALKQITTYIRGSGWGPFGTATGGGIVYADPCGTPPNQAACEVTITTLGETMGYRMNGNALERSVGGGAFAPWIGPAGGADVTAPNITAFQVNCFALATGALTDCFGGGIGRLEAVLTASRDIAPGANVTRTFTASVIPPSAFAVSAGGGAPKSPF